MKKRPGEDPHGHPDSGRGDRKFGIRQRALIYRTSRTSPAQAVQPRSPRRRFQNGNPAPRTRPLRGRRRTGSAPRRRPGRPREGSRRETRLPSSFLFWLPPCPPSSPANSVAAPQDRVGAVIPSPGPSNRPHLFCPAPEVTAPPDPAGVPSGLAAAAAGRWRRRDLWNGASWRSAVLNAKNRGTLGNLQFAALVRKQPSRARSDPSPRAPPVGLQISELQFILLSPHAYSPGVRASLVSYFFSPSPSLCMDCQPVTLCFLGASVPVIPREPRAD